MRRRVKHGKGRRSLWEGVNIYFEASKFVSTKQETLKNSIQGSKAVK